VSLQEALDDRVREIVREEMERLIDRKAELLFNPEELATRWQTDKQTVYRLVRANLLRSVKLSERAMRFTIQEVRRFEESGGVERMA
jgi:hypothetical protein